MRMPLLTTAILIWFLVIACGLGQVWSYARTSNARSTPPEHWPASLPFSRSDTNGTLVLALHPRCPCTRATIAELQRVLADAEEKPAVVALIYRPAQSSQAWDDAASVQLHPTLTNLRSVDDVEGKIARQFGLNTSGEIILYDRSGALRYSGGITGSRGHEGPNPGQAALLHHLQGQASVREFPVFGCSIRQSACERLEEGECR